MVLSTLKLDKKKLSFLPLRNNAASIGLSFLLASISAIMSSNVIITFSLFILKIPLKLMVNKVLRYKETKKQTQQPSCTSHERIINNSAKTKYKIQKVLYPNPASQPES